ncbi:MAG: hypothetical protein ACXWQO_01865 [Bdellovibrionota bacterium]
MKFLAKIFVLLFTIVLIGAGFVWSGRLDFSLRNAFSGLDALLSTIELKLGSHSNGLSGFLAEKAGNCAGLNSEIYSSTETIRLESLENFPFSVPLSLWGPPSLSSTAPQKPNLKCRSADGRVLNVQALPIGVISIERMFGGPFRLGVRRGPPMRIFGENLLFLLKSSLGMIEIRSEGAASLIFTTYLNKNTDIEVYDIKAEQGTIRADIIGQNKGPNESSSIIELRAIGGGRLFWKNELTPVTEKSPGVVLPSGFSFR